MRRLLLCLPLCLLMAPSSLPALPDAPAEAEKPAEQSPRREPTPNEVPLPDSATMEKLAKSDPVAFLQQCLRYYERNVRGYHLVMQKQERLAGELRGREEIEVWFREKPYAVHLNWIKGARLAQRALYADGENDGNMLVRPAGWRSLAGIVTRDPEGPEAKQSGRVSLKQYGLKNGLLRALKPWEAARGGGKLHVGFLGEQKLAAAGDRVCLGLKRDRFATPENDGVAEQTLWFDRDTWLMVGSIAKDAKGNLIGEYYFRDVKLNPKFEGDPFRREALK